MPHAERRLVAELRAGRPEAFERLVALHGRRIEAVARRIVRDPDAAGDVVQEVYLAIFRGIHRFRGTCRLGSWVHRITVNQALVALRRLRRRPEVPLPDGLSAALTDAAEAADAQLERAELGSALRRELRALAPRDRRILALRYLEEREPAEVARRLGLSAAAAKSRTHRARARLLATVRSGRHAALFRSEPSVDP